MKLWPFRRETRAGQSDYTARAVEASYDRAMQPGETAMATAALETCAGIYARAFASAKVEGAPDDIAEAVTPDALALIARNLIRRGESCHAITLDGSKVVLVPVGDFDVQSGGYDPATWRYRCTLYGPSRQTTRNIPWSGVVHPRYSVGATAPWRGVGPLRWAELSAKVVAGVEASLEGEYRIPPNVVIPTTEKLVSDNAKGATSIAQDLKLDAGAIHMVTHSASNKPWADNTGQQHDQNTGWRPIRIGPEVPESSAMVRDSAAMSILAACGVPPALASGNSDGTSQRESWRRLLHGSITPLADVVTAELRDKLDTAGLRLSFEGLFASDLTGRARAFGSMVQGGMDVARAAGLSGLMEMDDA